MPNSGSAPTYRSASSSIEADRGAATREERVAALVRAQRRIALLHDALR